MTRDSGLLYFFGPPCIVVVAVVLTVSFVCCSVAGHRAQMIGVGFYSATKYAVTALTEGLRAELVEAQSHIRVSVNYRYAYLKKKTFVYSQNFDRLQR